MSQAPQRPRLGHASAPPIHFATPPSSVVTLHIAYSGRHPGARNIVEQRLGQQLRGSGMGCWTTDGLVVLCDPERPITPHQWSRVIGWLLCQPEVVLVARMSPLTRRTHGPSQ